MHQVGRSLFHLHVALHTFIHTSDFGKATSHLCMGLLVVSQQYEKISFPVSPWEQIGAASFAPSSAVIVCGWDGFITNLFDLSSLLNICHRNCIMTFIVKGVFPLVAKVGVLLGNLLDNLRNHTATINHSETFLTPEQDLVDRLFRANISFLGRFHPFDAVTILMKLRLTFTSKRSNRVQKLATVVCFRNTNSTMKCGTCNGSRSGQHLHVILYSYINSFSSMAASPLEGCSPTVIL
jgi:hypothetical protein